MSYPSFPAFDGRPGFPRVKAPRASTIRQKAISGRETFQPQWSYPLYDITLDFAVLNGTGAALGSLAASELQDFVGFYNTVMATPGGVFRWTDPHDNAVANEAMGAGDGATTSFQFVRAQGGFAEPVLAPVNGPDTPIAGADAGNCSGTPAAGSDAGNCTGAVTAGSDALYCSTLQVFEDGDLAPWTFAGGSADASGGIVVIDPAPGDGAALTWTGSFDWLCRFSEDTLAPNEFMFGLFELKQVKLSTVRL